MLKILSLALLLIPAMLSAENLNTITNEVFKDSFSDYTIDAYDFGSIAGSFAHTYIRQNDLSFVGSMNMGKLKPFVDLMYVPGGFSPTDFNTDELNVDSSDVTLNRTVEKITFSDMTNTRFNARLRAGLGIDLGAMKLGFALNPYLAKRYDAYTRKRDVTRTVPPATLPAGLRTYNTISESGKLVSDRNSGSLGIEAGLDAGIFGANVDLTFGGRNNDVTYTATTATTTNTWNALTGVYDVTTTSAAYTVKGVNYAGATAYVKPDDMSDANGHADNINIPDSGYSSTTIGVLGYFAGMKDGLGILYLGAGITTRSYDVKKSEWTGTNTTAGGVTTTRSLTNEWNVSTDHDIGITARVKKIMALSPKLEFGLYPRYDLTLTSMEATMTLRDETTSGVVIAGESSKFTSSYMSNQLSLPIVLKHQTLDNLAMYITVTPSVSLFNSFETTRTLTNATMTTTAGGMSVPEALSTRENTTHGSTWTAYGADFACLGLNWTPAPSLMLGGYFSANTANIDMSGLYANLTYLFGR